MECFWPRPNPSSSSERSLSPPSQLSSAWGHEFLPRHLAQKKDRGWDMPKGLLAVDRGVGSCFVCISDLPTYTVAFSITVSGWPSLRDNPSSCHPFSQVKAPQCTARLLGPADTMALRGTIRKRSVVQDLLSHHKLRRPLLPLISISIRQARAEPRTALLPLTRTALAAR